jgi:hypothetical protein
MKRKILARRSFIRHCHVKNLAHETIKYYQTALKELRIESGLKDSGINMYIGAWRVFFVFYMKRDINENPTEAWFGLFVFLAARHNRERNRGGGNIWFCLVIYFYF